MIKKYLNDIAEQCLQRHTTHIEKNYTIHYFT